MRALAKLIGLSEVELTGTSGNLAVGLLTLPFRIAWGFIYFMVFSWTASRSGVAFFLAFPAMIGLVGFVALIWVVGYKGDNKAVALSRQFSRILSNPNRPEFDPEMAQKLASKVVDETPENVEHKYNLGVTFEVNGQLERAVDLMTVLAPLDEGETETHAPAHLWLSRYFANSDAVDLPEAEREAISRQHLDKAVAMDPENIPVLMTIAEKARNDIAETMAELEALPENSTESAELESRLAKLRQDALNLYGQVSGLESDGAEVYFYKLFAGVARIQIIKDAGDEVLARNNGEQFINQHIFLSLIHI